MEGSRAGMFTCTHLGGMLHFNSLPSALSNTPAFSEPWRSRRRRSFSSAWGQHCCCALTRRPRERWLLLLGAGFGYTACTYLVDRTPAAESAAGRRWRRRPNRCSCLLSITGRTAAPIRRVGRLRLCFNRFPSMQQAPAFPSCARRCGHSDAAGAGAGRQHRTVGGWPAAAGAGAGN